MSIVGLFAGVPEPTINASEILRLVARECKPVISCDDVLRSIKKVSAASHYTQIGISRLTAFRMTFQFS
jgi:hypothetical protein